MINIIINKYRLILNLETLKLHLIFTDNFIIKNNLCIKKTYFKLVKFWSLVSRIMGYKLKIFNI